jgi:Polyketide cyclase / dehydrase and lipid transport
MKPLKVLGLAAILIVMIVLIFTLIQPSKGYVERTVVINAPVQEVFRELNTYQTFTLWSPWAKMDANAKYTYDGPDSGVGAKMAWEGKSIGKGSQWIEASTPDKHIKNVINFEDLNGVFYAQYILEPEGNQTKLTWTYDGVNNGFLGKMRWLFMKGALGAQYEEGLHDLKYLIEKRVGTAPKVPGLGE